MTREEMIEMAAFRIYPDDQAARLVFIAGAMFADNHPDISSLWHDETEMPDCGSTFIAIDSDNNICDCIHKSFIDSELLWKAVVQLRNIKKWLYITDLLQKGGEKKC